MVAQDVTQRRQSEQSFLHAEKLRVTSQLAAGVAHDANNDLAVILGYSEYMLGKVGKLEEEDHSALSAIQLQVWECAGTVRRIQLLSRSVPRSKFTYFQSTTWFGTLWSPWNTFGQATLANPGRAYIWKPTFSGCPQSTPTSPA